MIRYYLPITKKHDPFSNYIANYPDPYVFHAVDDYLDIVLMLKFLFGHQFNKIRREDLHSGLTNRISFR